MQKTRLTGKDWLESQGVAYRVISVNPATLDKDLPATLNCAPSKVLVSTFFLGTRAPVIVVHALSRKVNMALLSKHVGDTIKQVGSEEDCQRENGLSLAELHPFLENYSWKVLDEQLFENEKIYIRAGEMGEVLEIEANNLKYVIGVVNGLLANVTDSN